MISFFSLRLAAEDGDQAVAFAVEFVLLAADLHFLEPRQLPQLGVEDVVGLVVGQLEACDQRGLGFVLAADDADDFIQVEEGDQQAFEQVQPALDLVQPVAAGAW